MMFSILLVVLGVGVGTAVLLACVSSDEADQYSLQKDIYREDFNQP